MKKITFILTLIMFVSCDNNTITISKDEYNQLKGVKLQSYPKPFRFLNSTRGTWHIILGENGHEYLANEELHEYVCMYYIDCILCAERNKIDTVKQTKGVLYRPNLENN